MPWLRAAQLETFRLTLEPLEPQHATEMVPVLAAPELYTFTGGEPPTDDDLCARYQRQSGGQSPTGDAGWLNWVIRTKETGAAIGYVQATLTMDDDGLVADVAWLVTPSEQNQGFATEASRTMLAWLLDQHVRRIRALIHPDHDASARIAHRLGLTLTSVVVDDELLWEHTEYSH
ncbi:GNAT family N-acetyltransferase [Arthrobacter sp. CP30]